MMTVIETYAPALIAALLIGLIVAFWALRRSLSATPPATIEVAEPVAPVAPDVVTVPEITESTPPELIDAIAAPEVAVADGPADDLQTLKGVGAKFAAKLNEAGITRFDQIASLTTGEVADLDDRMGAFKGRLLRDRVVEQATFLARDDRAGFESAFGKIGTGEALG